MDRRRRGRAMFEPNYDVFMRSRVRTLALFLMLGAIITIVLAWSFALMGSLGPTRRETMGRGVRWPARVPDHWPDAIYVTTLRGRRISFSVATGVFLTPSGLSTYSLTNARFGWPFHALQWSHGFVDDPSRGEAQELDRRWIMAPDWLEEFASAHTRNFPARRRLPLDPVWPGFLASVLMYGGGLWLLLRGRRELRTLLRRRRRCCIACGYPIGHSPICTECGAVLWTDSPRTTTDQSP